MQHPHYNIHITKPIFLSIQTIDNNCSIKKKQFTCFTNYTIGCCCHFDSVEILGKNTFTPKDNNVHAVSKIIAKRKDYESICITRIKKVQERKEITFITCNVDTAFLVYLNSASRENWLKIQVNNWIWLLICSVIQLNMLREFMIMNADQIHNWIKSQMYTDVQSFDITICTHKSVTNSMYSATPVI